MSSVTTVLDRGSFCKTVLVFAPLAKNEQLTVLLPLASLGLLDAGDLRIVILLENSAGLRGNGANRNQ